MKGKEVHVLLEDNHVIGVYSDKSEAIDKAELIIALAEKVAKRTQENNTVWYTSGVDCDSGCQICGSVVRVKQEIIQ